MKFDDKRCHHKSGPVTCPYITYKRLFFRMPAKIKCVATQRFLSRAFLVKLSKAEILRSHAENPNILVRKTRPNFRVSWLRI